MDAWVNIAVGSQTAVLPITIVALWAHRVPAWNAAVATSWWRWAGHVAQHSAREPHLRGWICGEIAKVIRLLSLSTSPLADSRLRSSSFAHSRAHPRSAETCRRRAIGGRCRPAADAGVDRCVADRCRASPATRGRRAAFRLGPAQRRSALGEAVGRVGRRGRAGARPSSPCRRPGLAAARARRVRALEALARKRSARRGDLQDSAMGRRPSV